LQEGLTKGLIESGIAVIDLGMTGTEEVYFATRHLKAIGGIQITDSHNPLNYNGMILVGADASPISTNSGLDK
ncbi:phosphomannomutase CpsG, partial [Vibrio echinoideorum]